MPASHLVSVKLPGHTPLHLAVMLGHTECADALIKAGASVQPKLPDGWPIVAEAVSRGEPDLGATSARAVFCRIFRHPWHYLS